MEHKKQFNPNIQNIIEKLNEYLVRLNSLNWFQRKFKPPQDIINEFYKLDAIASQYLQHASLSTEQEELLNKYFKYVFRNDIYKKFPKK